MAEDKTSAEKPGPGRIIATAQVMDHALTLASRGVQFDYSHSRFSFLNPDREHFIVLLTDITKNTFSTSTTIAIDWSDVWVDLRNKALDTGNRLFAADNFNIAIVTVD